MGASPPPTVQRPNFPLLVPGCMVYFTSEKRGYRVMARSERYLVAVKTHKDTYLYTIVDFQDGARGPDNRIFSSHAYNTRAGAESAVDELERGSLSVSGRRRLPLDIDPNDPRAVPKASRPTPWSRP